MSTETQNNHKNIDENQHTEKQNNLKKMQNDQKSGQRNFKILGILQESTLLITRRNTSSQGSYSKSGRKTLKYNLTHMGFLVKDISYLLLRF